MIPHDDLAGLEFLKITQNRAGFVRLAFGEIILSLIALSCRRMRLAVSPISFRLTNILSILMKLLNQPVINDAVRKYKMLTNY